MSLSTPPRNDDEEYLKVSESPTPVGPIASTSKVPASQTATSVETSRQYLDVPTRSSFRPSLDSTYSDLSELSIYSDELRYSRPLVPNGAAHLISLPPAAPCGWRGTLGAFWIRNKGVALVLLAQCFGSGMNIAARILETDGSHGKAMHPFQVPSPSFSFHPTQLTRPRSFWPAKP